MKKVFKKIIKVIVALVLCIVCIGFGTEKSFATDVVTKSKTVRDGSGYKISTIMFSVKPINKFVKMPCAGVDTRTTEGGIKFDTSVETTLKMSDSISCGFIIDFLSLGSEYGMEYSETERFEKGYEVKPSSKLKPGIYYLYLGWQGLKVDYKVQKCSINFTDWKTPYKKNITWVPLENSGFWSWSTYKIQ